MICINDISQDEKFPMYDSLYLEQEYPAHGVSLVANQDPTIWNRKKLCILTFGIENVGIADESKRKTNSIHKLLKTIGSYEFTLEDPNHFNALVSEMRLNYPQYMDWYERAEIVCLDCRGVGDPARDKSLRDHRIILVPTLATSTT